MGEAIAFKNGWISELSRARDLDLGSGQTAYSHALLIDQLHWNRRNFLWMDGRTDGRHKNTNDKHLKWHFVSRIFPLSLSLVLISNITPTLINVLTASSGTASPKLLFKILYFITMCKWQWQHSKNKMKKNQKGDTVLPSNITFLTVAYNLTHNILFLYVV